MKIPWSPNITFLSLILWLEITLQVNIKKLYEWNAIPKHPARYFFITVSISSNAVAGTSLSQCRKKSTSPLLSSAPLFICFALPFGDWITGYRSFKSASVPSVLPPSTNRISHLSFSGSSVSISLSIVDSSLYVGIIIDIFISTSRFQFLRSSRYHTDFSGTRPHLWSPGFWGCSSFSLHPLPESFFPL